MSQIPASVENFYQSVKSLQFQQRNTQWQNCIQSLEQSGSQHLDEFYGAYCEEFPFNYRSWNKYAQYVAKKTTISEGVRIFELSVTLNTWSVELWNCYCFWVKTTFSSTDALIVKQTYQRAVEAIGLDYYSGTFWEELISLSQSEPREVFQLFQRLVRVPFNKLHEIYEKIPQFLGQISREQLAAIYQDCKGTEAATTENEINVQDIIAELEPYYQNAISLVLEKQQHEQNLKFSEFDVQAVQDYEYWKKYILWESQRGTPESLRFLFQKCLISQSNQSDVWIRYFDLLTEQETLQFLETRRKFFQSLSDIVYYWAEILEATDPDKAVQLLVEQEERLVNQLGPYTKRIEIENRRGNYAKVEEVFAQLHLKFATNYDVKAYLVHEQALHQLQQHQGVTTHSVQLFQQQLQANAYTKQLFAYFLSFFQRIFLPLEDAEEQFCTLILSTLQSAKDENKLSRDMLTMTKNFVRSNFANRAAQLKIEQKMRDINFPLSNNFLENKILNGGQAVKQQPQQEQENLKRKISHREDEAGEDAQNGNDADLIYPTQKLVKRSSQEEGGDS